MARLLALLLLSFFSKKTFAQDWWHPLPAMPERVSNNAVVAAKMGGTSFVYSFAGIDSTKKWSGIHLKSWRFNTVSEVWQQIPSIPDPAGGKIAASASVVKNKIYLIGGYHVAANGDETSSKKTHRFDPETNDWLPDGADIPVAIDDQVQAVWRDSLIFVVTGWSNTANVPNVQIYNPSTDAWLAGSAVPNNNSFKAFGASGVIVGDTIFYCGGARSGTNFPAAAVFRKGAINPQDPTGINWFFENNAAAKGYRMAAATMLGLPIWLGGSAKTYNFDGLAYDGSGPVEPGDRILLYEIADSFQLIEIFGQMPPVMDLRGAAQVEDGLVVVAGGMKTGAEVTNEVWKLGFAQLLGLPKTEPASPRIFPNPAHGFFQVEGIEVERVAVFDFSGKLVLSQKMGENGQYLLENGSVGIFFVKITDCNGNVFLVKVARF